MDSDGMETDGTGDDGGFDDNPLDQSESLDSDMIRNDDGDEVADPPERWIPAKDEETLDERLADEVPDVTAEDPEAAEEEDSTEAEPGKVAADGGIEDDEDLDDLDDDEEDVVLATDDQLDRIDPAAHGVGYGQVDGTPEDGESFFDVSR